MTASGTLLVQSRLPAATTKPKSFSQDKFLRYYSNNKKAMSKALARELDLKMQQMREYALIAHGYHNENCQYPVHVRRSHDGEKFPRSAPNGSHRKKTRSFNSTILTPSSHENRTKLKAKDSSSSEHPTHLIIPPNKTINDIHSSINDERDLTSQRKSSVSSTNSSPILCSIRPHSITEFSLPITPTTNTDEQSRISLSNSSQSLLNPSSPIKTLTQRFFSRFFHHSSKSS